MALHRTNINEERRYIRLNSKYDTHCAECETDIFQGDSIVWDSKTKKVYCDECGKEYED